MSPRKKAAPQSPPPEPAVLACEGYAAHQTPDPRGRFFIVPGESPRVANGSVRVYRYRVTVERIEEPREVLIERMVALYKDANMHGRDALTREAREQFGVDLISLVRGAS